MDTAITGNDDKLMPQRGMVRQELKNIYIYSENEKE